MIMVVECCSSRFYHSFISFLKSEYLNANQWTKFQSKRPTYVLLPQFPPVPCTAASGGGQSKQKVQSNSNFSSIIPPSSPSHLSPISSITTFQPLLIMSTAQSPSRKGFFGIGGSKSTDGSVTPSGE